MIQLNLLPDVKLQYIRARQRKRLVVGTSLIVSALFITIFVVLFFFVRVAQKEHLSNLDKDVNKISKELKSKEDLEKILTVQNQLNSLPALHDQKIISSRLFDYLTQITPAEATISEVAVDFTASTLSVKGNGSDLGTVNKFADTLKFTDFESFGETPKNGKAFSEVVLAEFSFGTPDKGNPGNVAYTLTFKYDPVIFANFKTQEGKPPVALKVPNIVSTRSATEKPKALFVPQPQKPEEGNR